MNLGRYWIYLYYASSTTIDSYNERTTTYTVSGPYWADMSDDVVLKDKDGQRLPEHNRTYTLCVSPEDYVTLNSHSWKMLKLGSTSGTSEYIDTIERYSFGTQNFVTIKTRMVSVA